VFLLSSLIALVSGMEHHRRLESRVREGEVISCGLTKAVADMVDGTDVDWCACELREADGSRVKGFYSPMQIDAGEQELDCPPEGATMKIKSKKFDGYQIQGEENNCPDGGKGFIDSKTHQLILNCVDIDSYEYKEETDRRY